MISCVLKGGLGNQMFQAAAVISLSLRSKIPFCFDKDTWPPMGGAGNRIFQASPPTKYLDNVFKKLPFKTIKSKETYSIYNEPSFHYKEIVPRRNMLLNGYFQSEKYFVEHSDIIRKVFFPPKNIIENFKNKYEIENLVSIHVRRGSHLRNPHYHGSCDIKYFKEAVNLFPEGYTFLIFSDDIEWCRNNFIGDKYIFSENNTDYEDLYYMALCDHNIICNSTFSWWSAWLNKNNNKKVVSPKKWFGPGYAGHDLSDLIPSNWIVIDNDLEGE